MRLKEVVAAGRPWADHQDRRLRGGARHVRGARDRRASASWGRWSSRRYALPQVPRGGDAWPSPTASATTSSSASTSRPSPAYENFDEMLELPEIGELDGIVLGRVDMTGSMGMTREDINEPAIFTMASDLFHAAKAAGLDCGMGGGVSAASLPFMRELPGGCLDRYETRKVDLRVPRGARRRRRRRHPQGRRFRAHVAQEQARLLQRDLERGRDAPRDAAEPLRRPDRGGRRRLRLRPAGRRRRGATSEAPGSASPVRAVAFDLDGTLYMGRQAVPGAPGWSPRARQRPRRCSS